MVRIVTIDSTFQSFGLINYKSKKISREDIVLQLLDEISDYTIAINESAQYLEEANRNLEAISRMNEWDDEDMMELDNLLTFGEGIRQILVENYERFIAHPAIREGCKAELERYKAEIDDMAENLIDVERAIIIFPYDPQFRALMKEFGQIT